MNNDHSATMRSAARLLTSIGLGIAVAGISACNGEDVSLGRNPVRNSSDTGGSSTGELASSGGDTVIPPSSGGAENTGGAESTGGAENTGGTTAQPVNTGGLGTESGGATSAQTTTAVVSTGGVAGTGGALGTGGTTFSPNGVTLTARIGAAPPDNKTGIIGEWYNGSYQTIFVAACGPFDAEYLAANETWINVGWFVVCDEEPVEIELRPGQTASAGAEPAVPGGATTANTWRLTGSYGVGCTPGVKFSEANCSQLFELTSNVVTMD